MNRPAIIKAAFYMAKALGQAPSRRNVNAIIEHQTGKGFRPADVAAVLKLLVGNHLGTDAKPRPEPQPKHKTGQSGTTTGTTAEPATLINVTSNIDSPTENPPPKPLRLSLRSQAEITADEVLKLLEPEVRPTLKGLTWSAWRGRNRKVLIDMAKSGMSADDLVGAWVEWVDFKGYVAYTLSWFQQWVSAGGKAQLPSRPGDPEWWLDIPDLANAE